MPVHAFIFPIFIFLTAMPVRVPAQNPHRYDLVIDEIFADPTPVVGLPNFEYIELRNVSNISYHLYNWQIINGNNSSSIKEDFTLMPDSLVIICSTSAADAFAVWGNRIGVSKFPSLNNDGDSIVLASPTGEIIHSVIYDRSYYHNEIKSEGGWSMEMIDPHNPCEGSRNWTASTNEPGGTPGRINSVDRPNPDDRPPSLIRGISISDNHILLLFDEPLDSATASQAEHYLLDPANSILGVTTVAPDFSQVLLQCESPLDNRIVYRITASGIDDCAGNLIGQANSAKLALPLPAAQGDLLINEILFNPVANGYDYVELYNRSHKTIDLSRIFLSNREPDGTLKNISAVSKSSWLCFPGDFFVVTENASWVEENYLVNNPGNVLEMPALPSMPDDEGDILLLDAQGNGLDELHYHHQWHFALIGNEEGVALERIDYNAPTLDPANWKSAASTAGFGTPTYQNSEFREAGAPGPGVNISPLIFSPDGDGYEDDCIISYQLAEPGLIANITLFNAAGMPVRHLAQNATLTASGRFRWDGLDDRNHRLSVGIYIVFTEIFSLTGEIRRFKNTVTVARKLR